MGFVTDSITIEVAVAAVVIANAVFGGVGGGGGLGKRVFARGSHRLLVNAQSNV